MKKKKILLLILALSVFSGAASAQTKNALSANRDVARINKTVSQLFKKTYDVSGVSTEGATATAYSEKGLIKKIKAEIYGEMGRSSLEFFYKNEKLIFATEKTARYNKPFGKVAQTKIKNFYFDNGELVQLTDGKKLLTEEDEEFADVRERIVSLSQRFLENAKG